MKLAVDLVIKDKFTLRKASDRTGVAFQTLARYVKQYKEKGENTIYEPTFKSKVFSDVDKWSDELVLECEENLYPSLHPSLFEQAVINLIDKH